MDIDPVAADFRHCDFLAISRRFPGQDYVHFVSGGILPRSLRRWEMRKWWAYARTSAFHPGTNDEITNGEILPQRTTHAFQNFILFEEFQIALPLNWIGIILRTSWHQPGGCQPIPKK
jgi:hypothetical protein